jgi:hypothetical protein
MRKCRLLALVLLCGGGLFAASRDFVLTLQLTNSHLGQIFLGCQQGATDGFDRKLDDLAPPPGIQTGYAGFISTLGNTLLYKDIKAHGDPKEWRISLEVFEGKPLRIAWRPDQLPRFYKLVLVTADGEVDMATVHQAEFTASQVIAIVGTVDLVAVAAAEAAEAAAPKPAAPPEAAPAEAAPPVSPKVSPKAEEPVAAAEAPSPEQNPGHRVSGGVSTLILTMGGLLLLVVIFAAVRRQ